MRCPHLERLFENLAEDDYDHNHVSPPDRKYNCVAYAAGDDSQRWWPLDAGGYYWPDGLPKEEVTVQNFIRAFHTLGYRRCLTSRREKGIERVAIYVDRKRVPQHMARQTETGVWASKCGIHHEDIKHRSLSNLEGTPWPEDWPMGRPYPRGGYGRAKIFMKRRRDGKPLLRDKVLKWLKPT